MTNSPLTNGLITAKQQGFQAACPIERDRAGSTVINRASNPPPSLDSGKVRKSLNQLRLKHLIAMGRLPTSGYCQTCRKRRVKCDKARPTCARCISSGHTCGGYELPMRMKVLGVHSEHDGTQRMVQVTSPEPTTTLARLPHVPSPTADLRLLRNEQQTSPPYFFAKYGWAPLWRPLILSVTTSGFPEINRVCFYAISYGYTGLGRGDSALKARGGQLYGHVLREVHSLLLQPAKPQLAELCSTLILMAMYEFAMNKIRGDAPPHHAGITNILQYCGPDIFQNDKLLPVYRSCRTLLICQALFRKERCFLEDEPWKTLPWQKLPKTFEDRLLDIIVDLPGIAEAVVGHHDRAACLDRINTAATALQVWRWDWHRAHSRSAHLVRHPGSPADKTRTMPFVVSLMLQANLEFDSPRLALDVLYYNAALLYLMQLDACARGQPSQQPERLSPEDERYVRRQAAAAAAHDGNPLLLPGQARFRCQAAAEAYMTLSCITRMLGTTPTRQTMITPTAIGILYWVLRDQLQLGEDWLALLLSKHAFFHDAQRVFDGFYVSARVDKSA
ncbi:uncharacterized protein B0H64DRAFT_386095 [Chaetomium fimeti]|uniref:Zn(2)-C6 fungal-type domain-containing protein n=1 Tax=Chaetomium fimeti TaxID=1854472 RepID=A0AAE0HNA4_9PEZI|nr:hypothetical protein B0H64DRAFT_386095 [Chaetomium fimeti]